MFLKKLEGLHSDYIQKGVTCTSTLYIVQYFVQYDAFQIETLKALLVDFRNVGTKEYRGVPGKGSSLRENRMNSDDFENKQLFNGIFRKMPFLRFQTKIVAKNISFPFYKTDPPFE